MRSGDKKAQLGRRPEELAPALARHGVEIDLSVLEEEERPSSRPSQTGKLWDSVTPLEKTLGDPKKALSRDAPRV